MRIKREAYRDLDAIDLRILQRLQADARITMTDLAEAVGLSVTPCAERVRRLERERFILGYSARLNPSRLGLALLVYVELKLAAKSGAMFDRFRREVSRIPSVLDCHLISGEFDYLIKARIPEIGAYRRLLGDRLLALPGVIESRSYVVIEEIKETLELPLESE
ncbi:MAG: AsnC family transcriptional regulator [Burkholderiaceae bacterium]